MICKRCGNEITTNDNWRLLSGNAYHMNCPPKCICDYGYTCEKHREDRKIKILIIAIRKFGGVANSNNELKKAWEKMGHKVDIYFREDDFKIYDFLSSISRLRKIIKDFDYENSYDIIYTQDYSCSLPLLIPFPIKFKKHFTCFCGLKKIFPYKYLQVINGIVMGRKIIAVSKQIKEAFPRSNLIFRGVNFERFKDLKLERDSIGLIKRDIENITVEEFKEIARIVGLKPLIADKLNPSEMNNFYNKCKVYISFPRTNGFNNSWCEAMASGVPIVMGNLNGPALDLPIETVRNYDNQIIIEEVVDKIKNPYFAEWDKRKWLKDNNFYWEDRANRILNIFKRKI